jgi:formate hydrogenlyase subunit 3/multisubunit Na+/H+ antiporter MnhD subunit
MGTAVIGGMFSATAIAIWLLLAVAAAICGAVLALAQRHLKRVLAFSTITDMGLLTAGVVLGGQYGLAGATLEAAVHAIGKALLFASVTGPEAEGERLRNARGLASRHERRELALAEPPLSLAEPMVCSNIRLSCETIATVESTKRTRTVSQVHYSVV